MASLLEVHDAVARALPPGTKSYFGPDQAPRQESPPRVVWDPGTDSFGPPSQRGSDRADPTSRHTVVTALEAHIWGAGWRETYLLRDQFVRALRAVLGPNYRLTGGRWVGSSDILSNGKLYILAFSVDVPITDAPPTLATPTGELHTDVAFEAAT